jgi:S1-C subfamily serine protease
MIFTKSNLAHFEFCNYIYIRGYQSKKTKGVVMKKMIFFIVVSLFFQSAYAFFDEGRALLENEKNTISIYNNSVKSVVHISTIGKVRRSAGFFFDATSEVVKGEGTGFVWDKDGHIVTNFHVIQGGTKFIVNFHKDKKDYQAKLIGHEATKDIAVLKLVEKPKGEIHPLPTGDSKKIQVGQKALAIGNPFGLDSTITQGIISAVGRSIKGITGIKIYDMIQTDSSINPGNSGGPLINSSGEVIGVNTMIFSRSGSSAGVGFAVPVNTVKTIVPQVIKYGKVKRAILGISTADRAELEYYLGINLDSGLPIRQVYENSPAAKAGLRGMTQEGRRISLGDVILEIDGRKINSYDDIFNVLFEYKAKDKVTVKYRRGKDMKTTSVTLEELTNN